MTGIFVALALFLLMGCYVGCFKEEFDQENMQYVWIIVGAFAVLLLLWAVFSSFSGGGAMGGAYTTGAR